MRYFAIHSHIWNGLGKPFYEPGETPRRSMALLHQIRLQGPWEMLTGPADREVVERVRLPEDWSLLQGRTGAVRFRRRFHRPTGLDISQHVVLRLPISGTTCQVDLNGHRLSPLPAGTHSASSWGLPTLEISNVVIVTIQADNSMDWSTWQTPVVLEIHTVDE